MLQQEHRAAADQHRMLHGMFELANVAWPGGRFEGRHGLRADVKEILVKLVVEGYKGESGIIH